MLFYWSVNYTIPASWFSATAAKFWHKWNLVSYVANCYLVTTNLSLTKKIYVFSCFLQHVCFSIPSTTTLSGQIFAGRNFREFSRFLDFFQEIRENFSHEKYFLPPFEKINSREKLEIGQFAKLNLYAAEKWKNTPVKFWKNLRITKLNPRKIKKFREFLSSQKFSPQTFVPIK